MEAQLSDETRETLQSYQSGRLQLRDLDLWLSQAGFDDDLPEAERGELAAILQIVVEIGEGLASEQELRSAIARLLPARSRSRIVSDVGATE